MLNYLLDIFTYSEKNVIIKENINHCGGIMRDLNVEICVCTKCVMTGAMDIMVAIERLKELAPQFEDEFPPDVNVVITPVKHLGTEVHKEHCPIVSINGRIFLNANSQTIMAEIVSFYKEGNR